MPKLIIDSLEIEVLPGTSVIEAAEQVGIMIPRFCYHHGLGAVGACRLCAVKFVEGPVKGVQMSCMVAAADGMVVSTTDEEAVDFRRHVIEWLMLNHPHDCPVCDEGGHCLLQDMTVSGGHGIRRYLGKKWTYRDQYLGPFVQHEMNRCIHCWRCRRFYQEFAGYRDLGAMQIGHRTYFGRQTDGALESPFSGNLIDLCPTGVYTDKPARFKGRRWDFERGPSLCIHCSLGCHTVASARYREVLRQEGRFSQAVNGYFICDRGRFGHSYASHPERPRQARIGEKPVSLKEAAQAAAEKLVQISRKAGPDSIASQGSTRSSLESQAMLKRFCRLQGWKDPGYFWSGDTLRKIKSATSRMDARLTVSLREVETADFILVIGADPLNEAPMLALAMRQAWRNGATVALVDPRPVSLPFPFHHLAVLPQNMELCATALIKGAVSRPEVEPLGAGALRFYDSIPDPYPFDPSLKDRFSELIPKLRKSRNAVVVCGTDHVEERIPGAAADHVLLLQSKERKVGLFHLMPGANAFGAALLSSEKSFMDTLEAIEGGMIKALVLVESDPFYIFPDRQRLEEALAKLDLLIVLDYLPSRSARFAHIFLPTSTLFETDSTFINQEGRVQFAAPVHLGGIPIEQLTGGDPPPRLFRGDIPGGEPKAAWQILGTLAMAISPSAKEISREELWAWIAGENPVFSSVYPLDRHSDGIRLEPGGGNEKAYSIDPPERTEKQQRPEDGLQLLLADWTFGTEELSGYSRSVREAENPPFLSIHAKDAGRLEIRNGDKVRIQLDGGPLEVEARVVEEMAAGVIVLPRHHRLVWQRLKTLPAVVPFDRINPPVA